MIEDVGELLPPISAEEKLQQRRQRDLHVARSRELERRIVIDPAKLEGEAHIKGTRHTIKAIRAEWKRHGVRVHDLRKRFSCLKNDDIEAALFHWRDPDQPEPQPETSYVATWDGPPRRTIWIFRASDAGVTSELWQIAAEEFDDDGVGYSLPGSLDEGFAQILRYIPRYAPSALFWRDEATGNVVDIHSLTHK